MPADGRGPGQGQRGGLTGAVEGWAQKQIGTMDGRRWMAGNRVQRRSTDRQRRTKMDDIVFQLFFLSLFSPSLPLSRLAILMFCCVLILLFRLFAAGEFLFGWVLLGSYSPGLASVSSVLFCFFALPFSTSSLAPLLPPPSPPLRPCHIHITSSPPHAFAFFLFSIYRSHFLHPLPY